MVSIHIFKYMIKMNSKDLFLISSFVRVTELKINFGTYSQVFPRLSHEVQKPKISEREMDLLFQFILAQREVCIFLLSFEMFECLNKIENEPYDYLIFLLSSQVYISFCFGIQTLFLIKKHCVS